MFPRVIPCVATGPSDVPREDPGHFRGKPKDPKGSLGFPNKVLWRPTYLRDGLGSDGTRRKSLELS